MAGGSRGVVGGLLLAVALPVGGLVVLGEPDPPVVARRTAARAATVPLIAAPSPTASAPSPAAPRQSVRVVPRGDGALHVVPGSGPRRGSGPLQRYTVAVEGGLGIHPRSFAAAVEKTLSDPRSWGAEGRLSFQRVAGGPVAFRVVLASPDTTDRLCAPLRTNGTYSCASRGSAVVNAGRWLRGAASYARDLAGYRQYVVNHEVGHVLGHRHESCPAQGRLAPVMLQQTKGVGACRPNAWPFP